MQNKIIYLYTFFSLVALGALATSYLKDHRKVGYVTTLKVFEEFKLKKELEGDYKKIQVAKQSYLDSIRLNIETLMKQNHQKNQKLESEIEKQKRMYLLKEDQFNKENENLYTQYNEQIWKQINQFIEDYGREKGFDYVFGASGQGNIMYATGGDDLTKEIIDYVNQKYSGRKNS